MKIAFVFAWAAAALYMLLLVNSLWVYRTIDRAARNRKDELPERYEHPVYYDTAEDGAVDYKERWPGWDGWYFFMVPDERAEPLKMVRCSIMTGLYGLEGIDDYRLLKAEGLDTGHAAEYLNFRVDDKGECVHSYLPKAVLLMEPGKLEVSLPVYGDSRGTIKGKWPDYRFSFPCGSGDMDFSFRAEKIIWWADIPGIFTYFAVFGSFSAAPAGNIKGEAVPLKGKGFFEHGFARKPFDFDRLWSPVRGLKRVFPSFKPVRYHYELLVFDDCSFGGFMLASGFGIRFRDRGGLHSGGDYSEITDIRIDYADDPVPDTSAWQGPGTPAKFYRKWKVTAQAGSGRLEYTAARHPFRAQLASNMTYYTFEFEGTLNGEKKSGRGYGEYLHI